MSQSQEFFKNYKKNITIQSRVDDADNWKIANPILAEREIGYESNTGQYKIGDGTTSWNSLPYALNAVEGQRFKAGKNLDVYGEIYNYYKPENGKQTGLKINPLPINNAETGFQLQGTDENGDVNFYIAATPQDIYYIDHKNNIINKLVYHEQNTPIMNQIAFLGVNPIGRSDSVEEHKNGPEDTQANWRDLGTGYAFYSQLLLTNQPSAYGILYNTVYGGEVVQEFQTLGTYQRYFRTANHSGWHDNNQGGWTKFIDTKTGGVIEAPIGIKENVPDIYLTTPSGKAYGQLIKNAAYEAGNQNENIDYGLYLRDANNSMSENKYLQISLKHNTMINTTLSEKERFKQCISLGHCWQKTVDGVQQTVYDSYPILHTGNYNPNFETKRIFLNTNWEDGVQLTTIVGSIKGYDLTKFYVNYNYDLKIALDVDYLITQGWDTVKCKNAFQDLELYSYKDHNKMIALGDIDTSIIIPILVTATKNMVK